MKTSPREIPWQQGDLMAQAERDHLTVTRSERGFAYLPPIPSEYGGEAHVYESSSAMEPLVWVRVQSPIDLNHPDGPMEEAVLHLTAENAWKMADQLRFAVQNHYQGDATPEWAGGSNGTS